MNCSCAPLPEPQDESCPLHGEEALCGHCGHPRADHEQPLTFADHECCTRCSCLDWFAVGEEPSR